MAADNTTLKSRPPKRGGQYYQGVYIPNNPQKVLNPNPNDLIYRSGWERQFMVYLDNNKFIAKWGSELFPIMYMSPKDNRQHRYYPDFITVTKNEDGKPRVTMIEVKPYKETQEPVAKGKRKARYIKECVTYSVNQAKWEYARAYCRQRGWHFLIMTENELGV